MPPVAARSLRATGQSWQKCPRSKSEGVLVSRAYLNPENAGVKANFRVLPGFMGVFWKMPACEMPNDSISRVVEESSVY